MKTAKVNERQNIQKFANQHGYSDVEPYEVVKVVSPITVEVRHMDTKQTVFPNNFQIGGFSAHCVDNHNQDYDYISNPEYGVIRIRWSNSRKGWFKGTRRFVMSDKPYKHYDYNF